MAKLRVLVQAGHVAPREPGFEGGTGTTREQELTYAIRQRLCSLLDADSRFKAIPQPGDLTDVPCDAAVFLHGDGSANLKSSGYCFGFPTGAVNKRLATLIGAEFEKIPGHPPHGKDNYTGGLAGYYGYRRITTKGPEVLVEHGFLTNPAEQKWLFANLDALAQAEYLALCAFFKVKPATEIEKRRLGWRIVATKPDGTKKVVARTWAPKRMLTRLWDDGFRRFVTTKNEPLKDTR